MIVVDFFCKKLLKTIQKQCWEPSGTFWEPLGTFKNSDMGSLRMGSVRMGAASFQEFRHGVGAHGVKNRCQTWSKLNFYRLLRVQ